MKNCCLGKNPSPENFAKWCKKRGIFLHPDVAFLVPTKTMGYGVFARKPLPAGTVVVECPAASSLSPYVDASADSPSIAVLQRPEHEKTFKKDPMLFVVLRLLSELCRAAAPGGAVTPWRPWLEACPRMPEHFYFARSDEELEALGLTPVEAVPGTGNVRVNPLSWTTVAQQLIDMKALERWRVVQAFVEAYPALWPPQYATFELFCECMAQVSSRNFHREEVAGREGPYLLPGLDIINHSFHANCAFEMRGGGRKHATSFTVVTARPLQRGEQVYCSYGRIGLARFAVEFQFTTPSVVQENIVRFSAETIASLAAAIRATAAAPNSDGDSASLPLFSETSAPMAAVQVPQSVLVDMEHRVEVLQRVGLLYDEGFYLVQPQGLPVSAGMSAEEVRLIEDSNATRAAEVKENTRSLLIVVALLLCVDSKESFDDVYHHMSKSWLPPCLRGSGEDGDAFKAFPMLDAHPSPKGGNGSEERAQLKATALRFLAAKRSAAEAQDAQVDRVVGPTTKVSAANRCQLLHTTLQAEVAVMRDYAALISTFLSS